MRYLKGYFEPAEMLWGVWSLQVCVPQTPVKHLYLSGCREQSGTCSWNPVWQQLYFYCSGQFLGWWRWRCFGKTWVLAVTNMAQGQSWTVQVAILILKYLWDLKNTLSASLNFFSESFYYVFTPSRLGKREDIIEEADFMCQASMERGPSQGPEAPFPWHSCVWSYQISAGFNLK